MDAAGNPCDSDSPTDCLRGCKEAVSLQLLSYEQAHLDAHCGNSHLEFKLSSSLFPDSCVQWSLDLILTERGLFFSQLRLPRGPFVRSAHALSRDSIAFYSRGLSYWKWGPRPQHQHHQEHVPNAES